MYHCILKPSSESFWCVMSRIRSSFRFWSGHSRVPTSDSILVVMYAPEQVLAANSFQAGTSKTSWLLNVLELSSLARWQLSPPNLHIEFLICHRQHSLDSKLIWWLESVENCICFCCDLRLKFVSLYKSHRVHFATPPIKHVVFSQG